MSGPSAALSLNSCSDSLFSLIEFPGESGVDQLVEIIKILGTPSKEEILAMNPDYNEYRFP